MRGLAGKHFIVTGGGSGIGAATVLRLLEEGASVTGADINAAGLIAAREKAGQNGSLYTHEFDLGNGGAVGELVSDAVKYFGRLDGVANIAADVSVGTLAADKAVAEFDRDLWAHVLEVNLIGTATVIRECLPHLVAAGGGAIVNVSSAVAWMGEVERPAYAASKIALHALSRSVARAHGKQGVRCNVVAPGLVMSETAAAVMPKAFQDDMLAKICAPRLGMPEDLASAMCFLLSDESSWINGQIWSVDGGLTLRE